jgi:hypothetical protein
MRGSTGIPKSFFDGAQTLPASSTGIMISVAS